ncbi:MAG: UPF0182 family protein [Desulfitobacteriaceae bacterium]|nr:UPF0182 family protein [Desulfitobacteriaceae bacterium]MDD4346483.1 UPF0182 family protein [Desulfitobacteriaceae bacterium]MDD4401259.1 UPF0182 family protein [Desulfitobacteriaceae bacterium]
MRHFFKIFIISIVIIIVLLTALSGFYEDWLWFTDLGYTQLFWTPFLSKALILLVNGSILFAIIAGTLLSIRHAIVTFINDRLSRHPHLVEDLNRPIFSLSQKRVTVWIVIFSAIISLTISFVTGFTGWLGILTFLNPIDFDKVDPVYGLNLAFYFFKLPFLQTIYKAFFGPLFILTLLTAIFYFITGVIRFHSLKLWKSKAVEIGLAARRHLAILIGILFIFRAFGYILDIFQLLYSVHGHIVGAGYTDLKANLPVLKILIVLSIAGSLFSWSGLIFKEVRLITIPVVGIFVLAIVLHGIFPALVQSLIVIPNELAKEAPNIQNGITFTRYGFGLDKIQERDYPGTTPITIESLKNNQQTLDNIRLNDARPMLQTYTQKQGIRLYYKFNDIDIDRYRINGGDYRQVMLSARELSTPDLDATAKTFVNTRFKYTHGFGITASFANAVTSEGLPMFAVKDVPPITEFENFKLEEPRIYYGELSDDWVVVNTSVQEFDYPLGSTNAENNYQGKTGIVLTPFNKLMLSLHHGTYKMYLANEVNTQSRFLVNRNIKERVQKLAPFLTYDPDPYLVVDNGRLKWIIDAYTTSTQLPYARMINEQNYNYIRNSVKVVVDAYDGTVDFYMIDPGDPVILCYSKIFPGVFKDISLMPNSLISHLRYPEMLFNAQANMLKIFHMTDSVVFYNKEDAWDIAKELFEEGPQEVSPYYTILKIPGNDDPEFILMLPFTPASSQTNTRNNMISWLCARMDGDKYGQLLLYKLPKNTEIDGPLQIESRIDQDPEISKQLALWDQKGSKVIRGNLLALPIGGNFLYVEPIYLQSDKGGSIPEMKKVVLAYNDRLVMTENLGQALTAIFGDNAPQPTTLGQSSKTNTSDQTPSETVQPSDETTPASVLEQINQIRSLLDNLEEQLKNVSNE